MFVFENLQNAFLRCLEDMDKANRIAGSQFERLMEMVDSQGSLQEKKMKQVEEKCNAILADRRMAKAKKFVESILKNLADLTPDQANKVDRLYCLITLNEADDEDKGKAKEKEDEKLPADDKKDDAADEKADDEEKGEDEKKANKEDDAADDEAEGDEEETPAGDEGDAAEAAPDPDVDVMKSSFINDYKLDKMSIYKMLLGFKEFGEWILIHGKNEERPIMKAMLAVLSDEYIPKFKTVPGAEDASKKEHSGNVEESAKTSRLSKLFCQEEKKALRVYLQ